ncbi:hypothetical protein FRC00_014338 [Tulasnella sp. 408]|nr:hypothetical protein FRC00_014338 [Tulasnella sp. 408]
MLEEGISLTTGTGLKGTARYYSPELILEPDVKHSLQSDIWAWGCLILEASMSTGQPPLQTLTDIIPYAQKKIDHTVLLALSSKEPPANLESLSIPSPELKALLCKCWSFQPADRPSAQACLEIMSKSDLLGASTDGETHGQVDEIQPEGPNQDPKTTMLAHLQASEAVRLLGSAQAHQRALQGQMGSINTGPGPSAPTNPPSAPQLQQDTDTWNGALMFISPDGTPEIPVYVLAKPGGPINARPPQFVVWPNMLQFSAIHLCPFGLQELGAIIDQNAIPLCTIEPDGGPFGNDLEAKVINLKMFARLQWALESNNAGAAIAFDVSATPPGTGVFVFSAAPTDRFKLFAAVFLTQPIPQLSPPKPQGVSANPVPNLTLQQVARAQDFQARSQQQYSASPPTATSPVHRLHQGSMLLPSSRPGGIHNSNAGQLGGAPNSQTFNQMSQDQLLLGQQRQWQPQTQQRQAKAQLLGDMQLPGQPAWIQHMASQPGVGAGDLVGVVGMGAAGMDGSSAAAMGGIMSQQHINPQAQAQNRLLSGGMAGVGGGMGGLDAGGAGIGGGLGGNMMAQGVGGQMGMMNLPGGMVNMGGMNMGLPGGLENCKGITPEKEYEEKRGGYGDVQVSTLDKGTPSAKLVVTKTLRLYPIKKRPHRLTLRFARELRVWAGLDHPHILSLLGYHLDQNHRKAILVSDYMSNGDLKEYIEDQNPIWRVRLGLARDIADGLSYLHTRTPPICHGDLKMGNILVSTNLRAVVADFGLSTMLEEEGTGLTTSIGLKGTARYYSPELILESDAKHSLQSDIWAWGCLILETLTDIIPYAQKRIDHAVLLALSSKVLPANLESLSIPSPELKALLGKCWSFAPADRPSAQACLETMSKMSPFGASEDGETRGQVVTRDVLFHLTHGYYQIMTLNQALSTSHQTANPDDERVNYTCCGLSLPDLHALLEHFEESHVYRLDSQAMLSPHQLEVNMWRPSKETSSVISSPYPPQITLTRHGESMNSNSSGGQDPKPAAMLAHQQASEAVRLPGSAEAQQKPLQSRMGFINTGLGPSAPTNPPPALQLQQNTDIWNGTLEFCSPGGTPEITVFVQAKRAGPAHARPPHFVVWPNALSFRALQLRPFGIQELARTIKQNGIPLCTIEPDGFGDVLASKLNVQMFARLQSVLESNNVGAAIPFDVPAGPQGTGVFVFSPPPRERSRLLGAVFLTQPIPQLSPSESQGVSADFVQALALPQAAGGIGMGPTPFPPSSAPQTQAQPFQAHSQQQYSACPPPENSPVYRVHEGSMLLTRPGGIQDSNVGQLGGASNSQTFNQMNLDQLVLRQERQQQRQTQQRLANAQLGGDMQLPSQPAWMQRMASQPGVGAPSLVGVAGMGAAGMAGSSAAAMGGIMGQQHISSEAQPQNRLLAGGLNLGGRAGVRGGRGGFDSGSTGLGGGMGGNMMAPGVGGPLETFILPEELEAFIIPVHERMGTPEICLEHLFIDIDRITPEKAYEEKKGGYGDVQVSTLDAETPAAKLVAAKTIRLYYVKKRPHRLILRFARELRVWAGLNHPHVLSLLGYYLDENRRKAILVSDYMSNGDLKDYIEDKEPSWNVRLKLARDIADGLSYLHSRTPPICHGDLKMVREAYSTAFIEAEPLFDKGNILVSASLRAVLADFGLSTILEEEGTGLTTSTGLKGTVRYYSPELVQEPDVKHSLQSDIWAWGCLTLETLMDTVPYAEKRTDPALWLALAKKEAPVNLKLLSIQPVELETLLEMCWNLEPIMKSVGKSDAPTTSGIDQTDSAAFSYHDQIRETPPPGVPLGFQETRPEYGQSQREEALAQIDALQLNISGQLNIPQDSTTRRPPQASASTGSTVASKPTPGPQTSNVWTNFQSQSTNLPISVPASNRDFPNLPKSVAWPVPSQHSQPGGSAVDLLEVSVVFCLDSSALTRDFWQKGLSTYIVPLLQTLAKVHNQQATGAAFKISLGLIVFTLSNVKPPLLSNTYFTDGPEGLQQLQSKMFSRGLGATTNGGDSGMAAIEGLVAAVEVCDRITSEAAKPRRANAPPNFPQQPQRKQPICHIILFTSQPPGGSPVRFSNNDHQFDGMTMDTLPAEIAKISHYVDFFHKVGEQAEKPWFNTAPEHVLLLSGFQSGAAVGGVDAQSNIKRPVSPSTRVPSDTAKKAKLATSRGASNKATPTATAPQDSINGAPQASPSTGSPNPASGSQGQNVRAARPTYLDHFRDGRDKAQAQINALQAKLPGPMLAQLQTSEAAKLPRSAEDQQNVLKSEMKVDRDFRNLFTYQGLINTGPGPSAPTNPRPAPQLQQNTDIWNGVLMFVTPDGKGGAQEVPVSVLAKRGGPTSARHPLQVLAGIIKQNGIPLCIIEPNGAPFGDNLEAKTENEQTFARLHQVLTANNAGAAIGFDVPAGPQGTGVFVFSPQPSDGVRLVGAAFLTQPIPQSSLLLPPVLPSNSVPGLELHPDTGGIGMGRRSYSVRYLNPERSGAAIRVNAARMFDGVIQNQFPPRLASGEVPVSGHDLMQRMASQPSVGGLGLASVVGVAAGGISRPSGAIMGGIMDQQHINLQPQSQAQNQLPSGDLNVEGMAGVTGEMGAFDGSGGRSRGTIGGPP